MTDLHEEYVRSGQVVGDTGDQSCAGSFCIGILQHLTKKYWLKGTLEELCISNTNKRDWQELTAPILTVSRSEFTRRIIQVYYSKESDPSKLTAIEDLFHEVLGDSWIETYNELTVSFLRDDDIFYPIVPAKAYYQNDSNHMDGLLDYFIGYEHPQQFSSFFVQRHSADVIDLINSVVHLEEKLKCGGDFYTFVTCFEPADRDTHLYLLQRMMLLQLTSTERNQYLLKLKQSLVEALENELKLTLSTKRDDSTLRIRRFEALMEIQGTIAQKRLRILEEEGKLSDGRLSASQRAEILRKIREIKMEGAWEQVRKTLSESTSDQKVLVQELESMPFEALHQRLCELDHLDKIDPLFMSDQLFSDLEHRKHTLLQILRDIFEVSCYQSEASPHVWICQGGNVFLSDCVSKFQQVIDRWSRREIGLGTNTESLEFHIQATLNVFLDQNFEKEVGGGRNLMISSKRVIIPERDGGCIINLSGFDGVEYLNGGESHATAVGQIGANGRPGRDGKSSGHLRIESTLPIEGIGNLMVYCDGGNGGDGEIARDGGIGRHGKTGEHGHLPAEPPCEDLISIARGEPGEEGKVGARGGRGGVGGRGGAKGNIEILSNHQTLNPRRFSANDGLGGNGGANGKTGPRGSDGVHGKDNAYFREGNWFFNSWQRADKKWDLKDLYKEKVTEDVHLEEIDSSSWWKTGKSVIRGSARTRDKSFLERQSLQTPVTRQEEVMPQSQSIVYQRSLLNTKQESEDSRTNLEEQAQNARNLSSLYARLLEEAETRKTHILTEIRLRHQISINMMENVHVTPSTPFPVSAQPSASSEPSITEADSKLVSDRVVVDPEVSAYVNSIYKLLLERKSYALSCAVESLLQTSWRLWNEIPAELKVFVEIISKDGELSICFTLSEFSELVAIHFESLDSKEGLQELLNLYQNGDTNEAEEAIRDLPDMGYGSTLRDIVLARHKRIAIAQYQESLTLQQAQLELQGNASHHKSPWYSGFKKFTGRVKTLVTRGGSSRDQALVTILKDPETKMKMFEELLTKEVIPLIRSILRTNGQRRTASDYFELLRNAKAEDFSAQMMETVSKWNRREILKVSNSELSLNVVPFLTIQLETLNFDTEELEAIRMNLDADFSFPLPKFSGLTITTFFLERFSKKVQDLEQEMMSTLQKMNPGSKRILNVILQVITSPFSHLKFSVREETFAKIRRQLHSGESGYADILVSVIADMWTSAYHRHREDHVDEFEFVIENPLEGYDTRICGKLNAIIQSFPDSRCPHSKLQTLEIIALELELYSFSEDALTQIGRTLDLLARMLDESLPELDLDTISISKPEDKLKLGELLHLARETLNESYFPAQVETFVSQIRNYEVNPEKFQAFQQALKSSYQSQWLLRSDFLEEALQTVSRIFQTYIPEDKNDLLTCQVFYFFRLKSRAYRIKHFLQSAWKKLAETTLRGIHTQMPLSSLFATSNEITAYLILNEKLNEDTTTKLQKLIALGISKPKVLEAQLLGLKSLITSSMAVFGTGTVTDEIGTELVSKLDQHLSEHLTFPTPYDTHLDVLKTKETGIYIKVAEFFAELTRSAETESSVDWETKLEIHSKMLIAAFEPAEEDNEARALESRHAKSKIMQVRKVQSQIRRVQLQEYKNLLLVYISGDQKRFDAFIFARFQNQKQIVSRFILTAEHLLSTTFESLLNHDGQETATTNEHATINPEASVRQAEPHAKLLDELKSVQLQSLLSGCILFQPVNPELTRAHSGSPSALVQHFLHKSFVGAGDASSWVTSTIEAALQSAASEEAKIIKTLFLCGLGPELMLKISNLLTDELISRSAELKEWLLFLLQTFQQELVDSPFVSCFPEGLEPDSAEWKERQEIVQGVIYGLNLLPEENNILLLKFRIWAQLLDQNRIFIEAEHSLYVTIHAMLEGFKTSIAPKTLLQKFRDLLGPRLTPLQQMDLALFYFHLSTDSIRRQLLPRYSTVSWEFGGEPTLEKFKTLITSVLTPDEDKLFSCLPNTDEVCSQLIQANPNHWLKRLEYNKLCHCLTEYFGELTQPTKQNLVQILAGWNCKFNGYGTCTELILNHILPGLRIQGLTETEFLQVFEFGVRLSRSEIETITRRFLPKSWMSRILLQTITNSLFHKYGFSHAQSCHEVKNKLEILMASLETDIVIKLFRYIRDDFDVCIDGLNPAFFNSDFGELVHLAKQGYVDSSFVTQLIRSKSISDWRKVFRYIFYKTTYPKFTQDQIVQIWMLEGLLGSEEETTTFVDILMDRTETDSPDFALYVQKLSDKDWVFNSRVINQILENNPPMTLPEHFEYYMNTGSELQDAELLEEFSKLRRHENRMRTTQAFSTDEEKELLRELREIRGYSARESKIYAHPQNTKIGQFSKEDIFNWAKAVQQKFTKDPNDYPSLKLEMVAVSIRGIFIHVNEAYSVRHTQILSLLLCIRAYIGRKSQFGQISTGEGKTDITGLLAIHLALCGKNVDVLTSGTTLAIEAAKQLGPLYRMFGIEMAEISSDACRTGSDFQSELERRYKGRVLYGTIRCFQADYLQNKYMGGTYMGSRTADYVIVDEVDSLLLDKGSQVLFISYKIPELRYLRPCFVETWIGVMDNAHKNTNQIVESLRSKICSGEIHVPTGISQFVGKRLEIWVKEAYAARQMDENEFYLAEETQLETDEARLDVTLMDIDTGEAQLNSQYSQGRHQALQLRHGKQITPECLKVIFISNHEYLNMFKGRLFGVTGTLGSERSKNFLKDHYNGDCFEMPRHRHRRCEIVSPKISDNEPDFLDSLKSAVQCRLRLQPTEIICQTVKVAKRVIQYLEAEIYVHASTSSDPPMEPPRIIPYICAKDVLSFEAEFGNSETNPGGAQIPVNTIIVSTNLGGRGTDLKVAVDAGLHVILTYIPTNSRIRDQANGRTSRCGKRGSTQYVIMVPRIIPGLEIQDYEKCFFDQEDKRIDWIENVEIPKNRLEGELFGKFQTKLREEFPILVARFTRRIFKTLEQIVKNRWAFWLDEIQDELTKDRENLICKFELFWKDIEAEFGPNGSISEDFKCCSLVSDYVKLAAAFEEIGAFDMAEQLLEKGVQMDSYFTWIPNYYLGILLLRRDRRAKGREKLKVARNSLETYQHDLEQLLRRLQIKSTLWIASAAQEEQGQDGNTQAQTQVHYLAQLASEIRVIQPHFLVLEELIGRVRLSPSVFLANKHVNNDEEESKLICDCVTGKLGSKFVKPLRFSRKVSISEVIDKISKRLDPFECHAVINAIQEMETTINTESLEATVLSASPDQRRVKHEMFRAETIGRIWNVLVDMEILLESTSRDTFDVHYDSTVFESLPLKPEVAKVLIGSTLRDIGSFESLQALDVFTLEHKRMLKDSGILVEVTEGRARLDEIRVEEFHSEEWDTAHKLLVSIFLEQVQRDPHDPRLVYHREPSEAPEYDSLKIVKVLLEMQILREEKINWNFVSRQGKESKFCSQITKAFKSSEVQTGLKAIYDKLYKDVEVEEGGTAKSKVKFEDYWESIAESFIASAGQIKRLPILKVHKGFHDISTKLPPDDCLKEVRDLAEEDFHRIPIVTEGTSWFSVGALSLSLLAVLQIGVGVVLGVMSGGLAIPLASLLISEGVGDLIFAAQAGITGNFSWKSYGINKAFSVAINLAWGGWPLANVGASFATVLTKELVHEMIEKMVWILGQHAVYAVTNTFIGIAIEKVLDNFRYWLVNTFRDGIQSFASANNRYMAAIKNLRTTIQELFTSSYADDQATHILESSLDQLGQDENSTYRTGLETAVNAITQIGMHHLSGALRTSGNKIVQLASHGLSVVQTAGRLLTTKSRWTQSYENFTVSQLERINTRLKSEVETLRVKQSNWAADGQQFCTTQSRQDYASTTENFIKNLNHKLVEDGVAHLQKTFVEPSFKAAANEMLHAGCESAFRKLQGSRLAHLNSLTDDLSIRFPGTRSGLGAGIGPTLASTGRENSSEYWLNFNPLLNWHRIHSSGKSVTELVAKFGKRIIFLATDPRRFIGIFLWRRNGGEEELALRDEAEGLGLEIVEQLEF